MSERLLNRGAIVTGGGHGIGLAVAKRLAAEGALVTIVDINVESGMAGAEAITQSGGQALFVQADVANRDAIQLAVSTAATAADDLSILVNCAQAFPSPTALEEVAEADWEVAEATGPKATFRFMQCAFPLLRASGHGSVINFTSGAGLEGIRFTSPYAAAKGAILALSRVAANEWSRFGIRVNIISPFAITAPNVPMDVGRPSLYDVIIEESPMERGGDAELDVAPVVAFLASDDASFVTGTILHADGGMTELSSIDYSSSPGVFDATPAAT